MPANLKWRNASKDNPGFTVWYANPERDPNVLYAIRRKRTKKVTIERQPEKTPNIWRVFLRAKPDEPLRTIYVAATLDGKDGAKTFVQDWEDLIDAGIEAVPSPSDV